MVANKQQRPQSVSAVKAIYRDPGLDCYRGNPLIEPLPPIFTEEMIAHLLQYSPGYEEGYRELPLEHRLHLIVDAVRFIQPLPIHLRLEQCFSRMIRSGYVGRNPTAPKFQALYSRLQAVGDDPLELPPPVLTTRGCSIVMTLSNCLHRFSRPGVARLLAIAARENRPPRVASFRCIRR